MSVVLVDFAVAKYIRFLHNLSDKLDAPRVVGCQIIAVRKMKRINVIACRMVFVFDQLEGFAVYR